MRICDCSSDVCSSDRRRHQAGAGRRGHGRLAARRHLHPSGRGASVMLAETVERRATTGWGEAAAKAAVFSASRLKGLVVPLALAVVWEAVARTGAIPVYLLPEIGRAHV